MDLLTETMWSLLTLYDYMTTFVSFSLKETYYTMFSPEHIHQKWYKVEYSYMDETYAIPVQIRALRPTIFAEASGIPLGKQAEINCTALVKQLLGPNENFHQIKCTPKDLGFQSITLWCKDVLDDLTTKTFIENEVLNVQF